MDTEELHRGRVFRLMRETAMLPTGRVATYEVVRHPGAAAMLAVTDEGGILLLRQHRHAVGGEIWEIPAGTLNPGEIPEECARRELIEETGFSAGAMELLSSILPVPGYSDEVIHIFLATGLSPATQNLDPDEVIEVFPFSSERVFKMISSGEIRDGKTLCALFLASRRGLFTIA
ncbi:MAG: NUDIX hydrolase [Deltaproteobacteria bacterium]|nr:NUDIX hydrolase [Deltaproteobacteria bacterium]